MLPLERWPLVCGLVDCSQAVSFFSSECRKLSNFFLSSSRSQGFYLCLFLPDSLHLCRLFSLWLHSNFRLITFGPPFSFGQLFATSTCSLRMSPSPLLLTSCLVNACGFRHEAPGPLWLPPSLFLFYSVILLSEVSFSVPTS